MNQANNVALEFHLYESTALIQKGKYKHFLKHTEPFLTNPYLQNELYGIQLQIQLIRRLLYCRLKVIKHYFQKFSQKQNKIISYLCTCMQLCSTQSIHFNKCQDIELSSGCTRNRKILFRQQKEKLNIKQFYHLIEKEPIDQKNYFWLLNQEKELFYHVQQTLVFAFMYFKNLQIKEAMKFLQKAYFLRPLNNFKSELIFLQVLSMMSSAVFEIDYSSQSQMVVVEGSAMLLEQLKLYERAKEKQNVIKNQICKITAILTLNLYQQAIECDLKNKYSECIQAISLAHFLTVHILQSLQKYQELRDFIRNVHEVLQEKFEQVILEEQDLNQFVGFLYGHKFKPLKIQTPVSLLRKKQQQPTLQEVIQAKFAFKNREQMICSTERSRPFSPAMLKFHFNSEKDNVSQAPTKDNTNILNITSQNVTRDNTPIRELVGSASFSSKQKQPLKKKKVKAKKIATQQSFLSQMVNLRKISQFDMEQKNQETELEKKTRLLEERLKQYDKPEQVKQIDVFFDQKINQITFEKCMTLDQVKEMAKTIISAEWEVHKEMPATKNLMKSISLSDIQFEVAQQFSKLREYGDIERQEYHNSQKEKAELIMKEKHDLKKLQQNQQKYHEQRSKQASRKRKSEPQLQRLMSLDTNDAGISAKFIQRRTTLLVNSYANIMQGQRIMDVNERKEREFSQTKKQLIDVMLKNLEERDDLNLQDQMLKQKVMPRQFSARTLYSPRGKQLADSRTANECKVFASTDFSNKVKFNN